MVYLQLEGALDVLNLDEVQRSGRGVQVTAGATGFGLPPVQTRWIEGAGDGAVYRGRRALPRDIDLPLMVVGRDRRDLTSWWSRLAALLADKMRLRMVEDDGTSWWTDVYHVGGGQYAYGVDTDGETELYTTITLRAGNPYWTAEQSVTKILGGR